MSILNQINHLNIEKQKVFFYHARKVLRLIQDGYVDLVIKPYDRLIRQQQIKRKIISKKDEIFSATEKVELYSKNIYDVLEDGFDYDSEIKSLGDRDQAREVEFLKNENKIIKDKMLWGELIGKKENFNTVLRDHLREIKKQNSKVSETVKTEMLGFSNFLVEAKDKLRETKKRLKKTRHIMDFKDEGLLEDVNLELNRRFNLKIEDIKPIKSMMFQTLFMLHDRLIGYDLDEHIKQVLKICMIGNKNWSDEDSDEEHSKKN